MIENKKIKGLIWKVILLSIIMIYLNATLILFSLSESVVEEVKPILYIILLVFDLFMIYYLFSLAKNNKRTYNFSKNDLENCVSNLPCPNFKEITREETKEQDESNDVSIIKASDEIDHQLDKEIEILPNAPQVDINQLEDANDEVESLVKNSEWDDLSTYNEILEKLNAFLLTKGLHIERQSIATFLSALSSTKAIFLKGDSLISNLFIDAFSNFFASSLTFTDIRPTFHHPIDLYFEARNNRRYKSEFIKSLYYALDNQEGIHFAVLREVNLATADEYLVELLPIFDNLVENHTLTLHTKEKDIELDFLPNLWVIGILENETQAVASKHLSKSCAIVEIKGVLGEKEEIDLEESQMLSFSHFNELIRVNREIFTLSEDTWKKIDELALFIKNNYHVTLGNKEYCIIEDYIALYSSLGYEPELALDSILSLRILPYLKTKQIDSNQYKEFLELLDKTLGVENNILSAKLLK